VSGEGRAPERNAAPAALTLGAIALILAVAAIAIVHVGLRLGSAAVPGSVTAPDSAVSWESEAEAGVMAVAFLLGLVALLTSRGRGSGLAAMFLAVAGTGLLRGAVLVVLPPYRYG
jgi:hypothetical protein